MTKPDHRSSGEQSNATFTAYETISTETEYSLQSFPTEYIHLKPELSAGYLFPLISSFAATESTLMMLSSETDNYLRRYPTTESVSNDSSWAGPSYKRLKHMNELNQVMPEISSSVKKSENSGSGNKDISWSSSQLIKSLLIASEPHSLMMNQWTPVPNMESVTIKVQYGEDIVKFILPASSSKADLVENILMRLPVLEDKFFVITYLHHAPMYCLLLMRTCRIV